jgi:hypothetical protein
MPFIRTASTAVAPKLFSYVRKGILELFDLDPQVRGRLAAMRPVDITPFQPICVPIVDCLYVHLRIRL